MHEKYPESFQEENILIEKQLIELVTDRVINEQLETKRVCKWIKFKSNKHIGRANTTKMSTHLVSRKRKGRDVPSKDIAFFNKDQSEEILPSSEKLKLATDNQQQQKNNKTYADVVVNTKDNSELYYKT